MEYKINEPIDLSGNEQSIRITTKQGDMNCRNCNFTLVKNGEEFIPPDGTVARISWSKPDGTQVLHDAALNGSQVSFLLTQQMLAAPGEAKCEVLLFQGDELLSSGVLKVVIMPVGYDYDEVESSNEYQTFVNALQEVEPAVENCSNATAAANSAAKEAAENAQEADSAAAAANTAATTAIEASESANANAQAAEAAAESANANAQAAEAAASRANAAAELVEQSDFSDIMYRMGSKCSEVTGSLNNVTDSGWYLGNLDKTTETPPNGGSIFYVLLVYKLSTTLVIQDVYFGGTTPVRYTRTYRLQTNNIVEWGKWFRLPDATAVS